MTAPADRAGPPGSDTRPAGRLSLAAPAAEPLLPRELLWLYPVAPLIAALLLIDDLLSLPHLVAARKIASIYIAFGVPALSLHLLYATLMPRLLAGQRSRAGRASLHLGVTAAGSLLAAIAVHPLHDAVCGETTAAAYFAVASVIIGSAVLLPGLAIQGWRNRSDRSERLMMIERQAALRAQLEALQARTNPHFFFNTLNVVAGLIPEDPQLAERTLERLAELFRYTLDAGRIQSVPLRREFDMVSDYLAIQSVRFGERLVTSLVLEDALAGFEVPPLLLQPLVENAILHGLARRQGGQVEICARRQGDRVLIEVRDDGPGPGASPHRGTATSMTDLAERVHLAFGERGQLALVSAPGGGCLARLALPARGTAR